MPFRIRRTITQPDGSTDVQTSNAYPNSTDAWIDANDQCDSYEDTMLDAVGLAERTISKEPGVDWTINLLGSPTIHPTVFWEVYEQ